MTDNDRRTWAELAGDFRVLTDEVASLRSAVAGLETDLAESASKVMAHESRMARMLAVLRDVEWAADVEGWTVCPVCAAEMDAAHDHACALGQIISECPKV